LIGHNDRHSGSGVSKFSKQENAKKKLRNFLKSKFSKIILGTFAQN
jgi:hypothetical protein